jgi:hypothetical protein
VEERVEQRRSSSIVRKRQAEERRSQEEKKKVREGMLTEGTGGEVSVVERREGSVVGGESVSMGIDTLIVGAPRVVMRESRRWAEREDDTQRFVQVQVCVYK